MRRWGLVAVALALAGAAPPKAEVKLWRLDCGRMNISDFADFSDARRYDGQARRMTDSCYLVRHGEEYLLWDTGLELKPSVEGVFEALPGRPLVDQLAALGVSPDRVRYVGISHYHNDHSGQAAAFPKATLLIGAGDWAVVREAPAERIPPERFAPWKTGGSKVEPVRGDKDVFGDGSVVMLDLPGHTPGHHALLVRLAKTGPVLLTGDLYHATESFEHDEVPTFNTDRADTLASFDRFKKIAANLKAKVVIQHEPADVAKLPAFPAGAD